MSTTASCTLPPTRRLVLAALSLTCGFFVGFAFSSLSGLLPAIALAFPGVDGVQLEVLVALLSAGALIGCPIGGFASDLLGRRFALLLSAVALGAGGCCMALSSSFTWLAAGRLLIGIAVGQGLTANNLFVSELAPSSARGRFVALLELSMSLGMALAFAAPSMLDAGGDGWRWALGLGELGPALLLLVLCASLPESPSYLYATGREQRAEAALRAMHSADDLGTAAASAEFERLRAARAAHLEAQRRRAKAAADAVASRGSSADADEDERNAGRRLLLIGLGLIVCQQISGQPTVMMYAQVLMERAGVALPSPTSLAAKPTAGSAVALAASKAAGTLVCLARVDTWGRRRLLIAGQLGQLVGLGLAAPALAGAAWPSAVMVDAPWLDALLVMAGLCIYVFSYGMGYGGVTWVVLSELFPASTRGRCMALTVGANWGLQMLLTGTFLSLLDAVGPLGCVLLWLLGGAMAVGFVWLGVPETLRSTPEGLLERAAAARAWFLVGGEQPRVVAVAAAPAGLAPLREPLLTDAVDEPVRRSSVVEWAPDPDTVSLRSG